LNILRTPAPNMQNPATPQVGQPQGQQPQGAPAAGLPQPPGEWSNSLKGEEITLTNAQPSKSWFPFIQCEVGDFHVFLCTGSKTVIHHLFWKVHLCFLWKRLSDTSQKIGLDSGRCAGLG
jgi:hypothetical protein